MITILFFPYVTQFKSSLLTTSRELRQQSRLVVDEDYNVNSGLKGLTYGYARYWRSLWFMIIAFLTALDVLGEGHGLRL